jgi:hypothetical protein
VADNAAEAAAIVQLAAQRLVLALLLVDLRQALEQPLELIGIEGLGQVVLGAGLDRLDRSVDRALRRQQDDLDVLDLRLSALSSSMPLMFGITRSVTTMDGRKTVTCSSASAPSAADWAVKPQVRTSSVKPLRVAGSSSTIRTRSAPCDGSVTFFNLSSGDET